MLKFIKTADLNWELPIENANVNVLDGIENQLIEKLNTDKPYQLNRLKIATFDNLQINYIIHEYNLDGEDFKDEHFEL